MRISTRHLRVGLAWAAILLPTHSVSGQDAVTSFLFSMRPASVGYGGDLTAIHPDGFIEHSGSNSSYTTFDLTGSYSDLYRQGGLESPGATWQRGLECELTHGWTHGINWEAGLRARNTTLTGRIPTEEDDTMLDFGAGRTAFTATLRAGHSWWNAFSSAGWGTEGDPEPAFGVRLDPAGQVSAAVGWQRLARKLEITGHQADQIADVVLDAATESLTGWARVNPLDWIGAEAAACRRLWIAGNPQDLTPTLLPWGDDQQREGFLHLTPSIVRLSLGLRSLEVDLQAYGRKDELEFAKVTAFALRADSRAAQLRIGVKDTSFLLANAEWGWIHGNVRGHTEFWPWTSGWVDFLGLRRYGRGEFGADFTRLHLGARLPVSSSVTLDAGLQTIAFAFDSHSEFEHWRPAVLVFGKEDVQLSTLKLQHATVGQLALGIMYRAKTWRISYHFAQLVPLSSSERSIPGEEPPPPSLPGEGGKGPREYGGATHVLEFALLVS